MNKMNVYKVCSNGKICANLETAIAECVRQMSHQNNNVYRAERGYWESPSTFKTNKLSFPFITKREGGYKVICIGANGKTYYREIDMFKPMDKINPNISYYNLF